MTLAPAWLKVPGMMKRILVLGALLLAAAPALAEGFLQALADVPLMPGLSEAAGAVVFDKPDGRIVSVRAAGDVSTDAARVFYREALPQLGWQPTAVDGAAGLVFDRAGERLEIDFGRADGGLIVEYRLRPLTP